MTLNRRMIQGVICLQAVMLVSSSFALTMRSQHFQYPKVQTDSVALHRQMRVANAHPNAGFLQSYHPIAPSPLPKLPVPHEMPAVAKQLTLREAIALALRNSPTVKTAELQRILDKFGLEVSIWGAYEPQISALSFSSTMNKSGPPSWSASTGVSLPGSTLGTTASIDYKNNLLGGIGNTTINVTQPLLKGFGTAFNRIPYDNAIDAELSARLGFKGSIIGVVVAVVNSYRSLVSSYNTLTTFEQSYQSQKEQVSQSQLQVKAGKMARSDLLQQQANLAGAKLSVVSQQESLRNSYQEFLKTLGLASETKLIIDKNISIQDVKVPSDTEAVKIALAHNISYQQALIALRSTERELITAKNNRLWELNMTGSVTLGGDGSNSSSNANPQLGFNLSIPINDLSLKQGIVRAKINLENARMDLSQQKQDLIRNVRNQLDSIKNQYEQIKIAELQVKLQAQTLKNAKLKLKYGKTTVFEVNSLINSLLQQEKDLIGTKISYLNAVTTLYQTLGITLDKWHIKLRY